MLEVKIKKSLGSFTLDIDFEADNGVMGFLGASGCGKSLTLKCIAGIEKPDEGKIVLNGKTMFDSNAGINLSPQERRVGYLFQQYALFPTKSVLKNIELGVRKEESQNKQKIVSDLIEMLHLWGLENHKPHQLSGGQQQRVALARILANKPDLLLLDEPFSALDQYLKNNLSYEIEKILQAFQGTTLLVTHNQEEVHRLAERVCVLSSGSIEQKSTVVKLFESPKTFASAILIGMQNFSRLNMDNEDIVATDWGIKLGRPIEFKDFLDTENLSNSLVSIRREDIFPLSQKDDIKDIVEDFEVLRRLEFPNKIGLIVQTSGDHTSEWSRLYIELDKTKHSQVFDKIIEGQHFSFGIKKDNLVFLLRRQGVV